MKNSALLFLNSLSSPLISIYGLILSSLHSVRLISKIPSSVLILPPDDPGSLGDEAMIVGLANYSREKGITNISVIAYYKDQEKYPIDTYEYLNMRDFFISAKKYRTLLRFIKFGIQMSKYERFYVLGADTMDGYYSNEKTFKRVKMVEMAAKTGLTTAILGFSYNNRATELSVKALNNLPTKVKLCAREKVSYERLINKLPTHSVQLVADLAFLLPPAETSEKVDRSLQWIKEQRSEGKNILGININNLLISKLPQQTSDTLVQAFVDSIVEVNKKNPSLSFIFLPHDSRNSKNHLSDDILANNILQKLPSQLHSICFKIPFPCQAAEIKAIVKHIDYVVTCRMHLAIGCLGQGTPVGCITYQDKFEGLYKHFDMLPLTISPEELFEPNASKLVDLIFNLTEKASQLKQQIESKLPEVKKMVQVPM